MDNLLSILTFLPLIAAFFMAIIKGDDAEAQRNAKWLALAATVSTFLISLSLLFEFETGQPGFQLIEERAWLFGLNYKLGVDGVSVSFVLLTTFLMPLIVASAWSMTSRVRELLMALLVLESLLIGSFVALDLLLFFVFVQGALLPLFLMLGLWGGTERVYAGLKLLLVALFGGALMLAAILAAVREAGTTDIMLLAAHQFPTDPITLAGISVAGGLQTLCFFGFFAAFAVYLALWPLHTWLPDALAGAPSPGALAIAALVTKLGGYGLIRICISLFPEPTAALGPFLVWLGVAAVLWAGLAALTQDNVKRMLAYASVACAGLVLIGLFSGTQQGFDGAILLLLGHALAVSGLFICLGLLQERSGTNANSGDLNGFGGLIVNMPAFALIFLAFLFALAGMPGSAGFNGLLLTVLAALQTSIWAAAVAGLILALFVAALFDAARRVILGDLIKESIRGLGDLTLRERAIFAPLILAALFFGLAPTVVLDLVVPTAELLLQGRDQALAVPG